MILDQGVNAAAAMIPVVPDLKIPGMLEQARDGPQRTCVRLRQMETHGAGSDDIDACRPSHLALYIF
jgi:hypothetical protein